MVDIDYLAFVLADGGAVQRADLDAAEAGGGEAFEQAGATVDWARVAAFGEAEPGEVVAARREGASCDGRGDVGLGGEVGGFVEAGEEVGLG